MSSFRLIQKDLSRNRHQLYCRKKSQGGLPNLRKSCAACRKLKIKCDSVFPECGRCQEKSTPCVYEQTAASAKTATQVNNLPRKLDSQKGILPQSTFQNFEHGGDENLLCYVENDSFQDALAWQVPNEPGFTAPGKALLLEHPSLEAFGDSHSQPAGTSLTTFVPTHTSCNFSFLPPFLGSLPSTTLLVSHMVDSPFLNLNQGYQMHVDAENAKQLSELSFFPRLPTTTVGRNFILSNIRNYAKTLINVHNTPSFIHSAVLDQHVYRVEHSSNTSLITSFGHIHGCKNILRMYQDCTPHTKAFIWRSIDVDLQGFMLRVCN